MDTPFATLAVQPPTVRCIGVEMRPFSLGHLCVLMHLESPFVTGELPQFKDLILGAFVCSGSWVENARRIKRVSWSDRATLWTWGKMAGKFDISREIAGLSFYIREGCHVPSARKPKNGRTLYSEWNTRLYSRLRTLGISHTEAMDMPLALANRLLVEHLEAVGASEFYTECDSRASEVLTRSILEAEAEFGPGQEIRTVSA